MSAVGIRSMPIGKFSRDRSVCAPQYRSAGTSTVPMVSRSSRVAARWGMVLLRRTGRRPHDMMLATPATPSPERDYPALFPALQADRVLERLVGDRGGGDFPAQRCGGYGDVLSFE